ncbi:aspartate aminotransferase family protein [Dactylosporangium sp. CA-233914]|uniref:aspartate aminotransferase family protein n=1 Tax=Dactylosporangium sp. CA-233914 TaxID=3239934 RepID=UPI003D92EABD
MNTPLVTAPAGALDRQYITRAKSVISGGGFGTFKLPDDVDFVLDHARGSRLTSLGGREFVDHVLSSGPMVIGHAHPDVAEALRAQLSRTSTSYVLNRPAIELAEHICRLVPCAESVKLVGDGSAATFYALRLARAFTGRTKIVKFEGGFHGYHDAVMHGTRPVLSGSALPRPDSAGIPGLAAEDVLVAPFNDAGAVANLLAGHEVAAVIVEPVQRAIEPRPGFLGELRRLTSAAGALLVFDELVTGFRLDIGGAQTYYRVTPDLCALGKILGGGLPLAAVAGRRDVMELAAPGRPVGQGGIWLSGTLNGNPLAAVAGLATLRVLVGTDALRRAHEHGRQLRAGIAEIARRRSVPLQVIGPDPAIEPVFAEHPIVDYASYQRADLAASRRFGVELIRRGVFVNPGAKWYTSSAHTAEDLELTLDAVDAALAVTRPAGA